MTCPRCGEANARDADRCATCGAPLASDVTMLGGGLAAGVTDDDHPDETRLGAVIGSFDSEGTRLDATPGFGPPQTTGVVGPGTRPSTSRAPGAGTGAARMFSVGPLTPGQSFGTRYHIIRLLGAGGMGAVYQAWDEELGVAVAIKVIRPDTAEDPAEAAAVERRFKRELLLARQVTHQSVVRIHDLGEIDGIKYITMPYVQGSDLATVLKREGRLPVPRALLIAKQVIAGLEAAHKAGVVHRDLKPANIMIDADGSALIMDFGIARSIAPGMGGTVAGAVVGTLEYMAPEQALARPVDHRADIYAFGLILYDMLVGVRQATRAESAVAALMQRLQNAPPPIRTVDASIPEPLEHIIAHCLEPDPGARYQMTSELVADLNQLDENAQLIGATTRPATQTSQPFIAGLSRPAAAPAPAPVAAVPRPALPWKWIAVAAAVVVLAVVAAMVFRTGGGGETASTATATKRISLAILPFRNASGNSSLDWLSTSLADMLRGEVGQSAQLRSVSSDRLYQVIKDLRLSPDSTLDAGTLRRLGEFASADGLVTGQFVRLGELIRVEASVYDARGENPVHVQAAAVPERDLLKAVSELAKAIRDNLALAPEAVKELQAHALKPSSQSVQALRYFSEGQQLARQGAHLEAVNKFDAAVKDDPKFALAYAQLAQTYLALGYAKDAGEFARQAAGLADGLPPAEKYLVLATRARADNDLAKAVESYEALTRLLPGDTQVRFELARLHEDRGAFDDARKHMASVLEADPKFLDALLAGGRIEVKRGNPQAGLELLNRGLSIAIQLENDQARAAILQAMGVAYQRLEKLDEALRNYRESLEIKERIGDKRGIASSRNTIAQVQAAMGQTDEAIKNYQAALGVRREIGDTAGSAADLLDLANIYADRGDMDRALATYKESLQIFRDAGNENYEALCLNNIGTVYLARGDYSDAQAHFERALALREKIKVPREMAETTHNLAETFVATGRYDEALGRYLRALELVRAAGLKRNTAIELFTMANMFEYQGRFGAATESKREAVTILRELNDHGLWFGLALASYGSSLNQIGSFEESGKVLAEASQVATQLKNAPLIAEVTDYQGERLFLQGDIRGAAKLHDQAAQMAGRTNELRVVLRAKLNQAKVATAEGRHQVAIPALRKLSEEADLKGQKYLAADAAIYLGDSLTRSRQYGEATKQLERALSQAQRLGARILVARAHHLLAMVSSASGDQAGARRHSDEARRALDEIRREAKTDAFTARSDLKPIAQPGP